jgi:hypothetical protein
MYMICIGREGLVLSNTIKNFMEIVMLMSVRDKTSLNPPPPNNIFNFVIIYYFRYTVTVSNWGTIPKIPFKSDLRSTVKRRFKD